MVEHTNILLLLSSRSLLRLLLLLLFFEVLLPKPYSRSLARVFDLLKQ
jgi:hypothetical protein